MPECCNWSSVAHEYFPWHHYVNIAPGGYVTICNITALSARRVGRLDRADMLIHESSQKWSAYHLCLYDNLSFIFECFPWPRSLPVSRKSIAKILHQKGASPQNRFSSFSSSLYRQASSKLSLTGDKNGEVNLYRTKSSSHAPYYWCSDATHCNHIGMASDIAYARDFTPRRTLLQSDCMQVAAPLPCMGPVA